MNAYRIETERLIIRCYDPKDAESLKSAIDESIEHLLPWMPWANNEPETLEQKVDRLRSFRGQFDLNQDYTYGIFDKDNKKLIGSTGLHTRNGENVLEIGYWIRKSQINKGYALEATMALTKVGIELAKKHRMEIHCEPNNIKSFNIPKKIGYTHEATLKNRSNGTDGNFKDDMVWTLFKEDYENTIEKDIKIKVYNALDEQIY